MNGKVLMLAIIFFGGFHVFYVFNRVQNFANIMYRLCAIQLGECLRSSLLLGGRTMTGSLVTRVDKGGAPPKGQSEKCLLKIRKIR